MLPELVSPASQAQSQRGSGLPFGPRHWVLLSLTAVRIFEKSNDLASAEAGVDARPGAKPAVPLVVQLTERRGHDKTVVTFPELVPFAGDGCGSVSRRVGQAGLRAAPPCQPSDELRPEPPPKSHQWLPLWGPRSVLCGQNLCTCRSGEVGAPVSWSDLPSRAGLTAPRGRLPEDPRVACSLSFEPTACRQKQSGIMDTGA